MGSSPLPPLLPGPLLLNQPLFIPPLVLLTPFDRLLGYVCEADKAPLVQVTGVEFPEVQTLWGSTDPYRSMGAGVREKKIAFISVKVPAFLLKHVQGGWHGALSLGAHVGRKEESHSMWGCKLLDVFGRLGN